jgi:hypothetical protein
MVLHEILTWKGIDRLYSSLDSGSKDPEKLCGTLLF